MQKKHKSKIPKHGILPITKNLVFSEDSQVDFIVVHYPFPITVWRNYTSGEA